uniref:RNase H type-1 domain-containing protein n=1 Tax=Brassica oleracea TaxID=3712 RepID=A0A3P6F327_BRAOL|nr:unnamed protein product [Brassica oleracea]
MDKAITLAKEWLLAQATSATPHTRISYDFDLPTMPTDVIRCNMDAAWYVAKRAGIGWVFENSDRQVYSEDSKVIDHVSSPLMAKALAMRNAMQEALHKSFSNVWFRTDSQELARAIDSKTYSVELFGVLMDIELLSSSFDFIVVSYVTGTFNGVADSLAKAALHSSIPLL